MKGRLSAAGGGGGGQRETMRHRRAFIAVCGRMKNARRHRRGDGDLM